MNRPVAGVAAGRARLGFLGVGWIGLNRMQAIVDGDCSDVMAIADPCGDAIARARELAPEARVVDTLEELLACGVDGVVIATPSALHAAQALSALEQGVAVFCQKPLGRTACETAQVVDAARAADRLLAVDFSYRQTRALSEVRKVVRGGELGRIYAADLVFHNAYGPDKVWFREPALSGGGCAIDLGIHLIDLALWMLDFPQVERVSSRLYAQGRRIDGSAAMVEDYAVAELEFVDGASARLACSWNLAAGCDAVIACTFHGTRGGASFHNVNGSFYDFAAERLEGTRRMTLVEPPDAWGGRAAVRWARQLAVEGRFDPAVEHVVQVAAILDAIYGR
jgi:predicted dehydrogenase